MNIALLCAMSQPIPVAILISGYDSPAGKQYSRDANAKQQFFTIPLWDMLTDRVHDEQVRHKETDELTLLAIYSQSEFVDEIIKLADIAVGSLDKPYGDILQLIHAQCRTGYHRASTFGNTLSEVLNSLESPLGTRLFNCQSFSLLKYTRKDAIDKQIDSAIEWSRREDPHLMPGGGSRERCTLYAYHAVAQREASEINFKRIWDWVDSFNEAGLAKHSDDVQYMASIVAEHHEERERSRSPPPRAKAHSPMLRPSAAPSTRVPPPPPPASKGRPSMPSQPKVRPPSHLLPWKNIAPDSDVARSWAIVLDEYAVDDASQHAIFALAQSCEEGRRRAFAIMTKLFKKRSDGEDFGNSSAFVWSSVKRAWDAMGWNQ